MKQWLHGCPPNGYRLTRGEWPSRDDILRSPGNLTSISSSLRAGSEVVFDFSSFPSLLQLLRRQALPGRAEAVFDSSSSRSLLQWLREPAYRMIVERMFGNNELRPTYYNPTSLTRDLKRIGFADVRLFGPTEMNVGYCKDRADGLRVPTGFYLVKARV